MRLYRIPFSVASLKSWLARPRVRKTISVLAWTGLLLHFAFGSVVLALRYVVLPQIETYRPDIERALTAALHLPVSIRSIDAGWQGLRPSLTLNGLEVRDKANRPALVLDHVEADIGWSSLVFLEPRLHRLEIASPQVDIRRDAKGRLHVAGLEVNAQASDDDFADWLLAQNRVVVRDAVVTWNDELRGAPPLTLTRLNFDLRNSGSRHRFGLTADPPRQMAARVDIRGDFKGRDLDVLESWKGEIYAELDYADLAVWRTWVDYPFELPQGSGGLRLWLGFAAKKLTTLSADVRLANVQLRLAKDLPLLDIVGIEGRIGGKRLIEGYEAEARHLTLLTRTGTRIEPTDFRLRYEAPAANRQGRGEFSANGLDLAVLTELASFLPLEAGVRQQLAASAPRGRLFDLAAGWSGNPGALQSWKVKGRFERLGLAAQGGLPGFAGVSGSIAGDEKGGTLDLKSQQLVVELPSVFAEPRLEIASLSARTTWQAVDGRIVVDVKKAEFQNSDAAGEISGTYRTPGASAAAGAVATTSGPGEIDIEARLTRASGDAVWRYMPLGVNAGVRDWLHGSLIGGQASEATLRLKGDLRQFPFRDNKDGIFEVKGRFRGATLKFAPGWPEMRSVDGELLFEGVRMLIKGQKGMILGATVNGVSAEITDLGNHDEILLVAGKAQGPTTEFLKFIEASPIGNRVDHFTAPIKAEGRGELDLKFSMPLKRIDQTRVEGRYRLAANRLGLATGGVQLADISGDLHFTSDHIEAQKIRATLFGAALSLDVATANDGAVTLKAGGTLSMRDLRQQITHPLLEHFSGSAPWSGSVRIKNNAAEARLESSLNGIASSLPEPFNKSALESRPLAIEYKPEPTKAGEPMRDQLSLTYGNAFAAQVLRRHDGQGAEIERGAIAIGMALPRLPERGLLLAARAPRLDADMWRRLLAGNDSGNGGGGPSLPISQLDVATDDLLIQGRRFPEFVLRGTKERGIWHTDVSSTLFAGRVDWNGEGAGQVSGRLSRLAVPDSATQAVSGMDESPNELPAINVTIDRFTLRGKEFGEVKLQAENRDGFWHAKLDVKNEDGALSGQGRWRPYATSPLTDLEFKLEAKSAEKLLARMGYPQAVRRGTATLTGSLNWAGSPLAIDYPSLSGKLKIDAASGQFNKLEPGVGRLIGVLSLQSLPRRIVLDFRDVFSEGFAFDSIVGESTLNKGIMQTNDMEIVGPSARVLLSGSVNLPAETQNLRVRVLPALGETVALGAVLANPAIGAVTWLAQKLFKDPFGRIFAFEYSVSGSWADPKVEKLGTEVTNKEGASPPKAGK